MSLLMFIVGLAMLLVGGRLMVNAASSIAMRLHVPPLLIGLTVVAWGTSAPELAFNVTAALRGQPELVFGNVVGANICNLGTVVGLAALITPLAVTASVVKREIPLMVLMILGFAGVMFLPVEAGETGERVGAATLLLAFVGYSAYVIREGWRSRNENRALAQQTAASEITEAPRAAWVLGVMLVGGLGLLLIGGNAASSGASSVARALGMSERVVGLTVVSLGTTLPELVTAIIAVRRGQIDLAVGNAVGSSIFNIGAIFGVCGLISPVLLPGGGELSLAVMIVLGLLLIPMSRTFKGRVARIEGAVLLLIHWGFIAYEVIAARSDG